MYEVHTHDDHNHTLAVADTLEAGITATDYLVAITGRQLAANGEGTDEYWLCLAIRDIHSGRDEYWTHANCVPEGTSGLNVADLRDGGVS